MRFVGIVGVDSNVDDVYKEVRNFSTFMLLISLVFMVITIVIIFFVMKKIGKNLRKLNEKILEVVSSEGDLTKKVENNFLYGKYH